MEGGNFLSLPACACLLLPFKQVHSFIDIRAYFFGIPVSIDNQLRHLASLTEQLLDSCVFCAQPLIEGFDGQQPVKEKIYIKGIKKKKEKFD